MTPRTRARIEADLGSRAATAAAGADWVAGKRPPRFEDELALVTGGSRGIGLEIARGLAAGGARVVLVARAKGRLARAVRDLAAAGGWPARAFPADVGRPAEVRALANWARRELPRLDVLVNCAAILDVRPFEELDERAWRRTLEVNLLGPARVLRSLLPLLRRAEAARVVNVSSIAGVEGSPKLAGTAAYAASKAGLVALTEVLGVEWEGRSPRINAVSYGSVETRMLRKVAGLAKPGMSAAAAAGAALFLASGESEPMSGGNLRFWA